ncbi:hypothetical protein C8Q74DRAFT_292627 [Fomes fomentarius]|nr:hypothetical protein C8Q74DRAFT_292627 [Fomes fomentarius]
MYLSCPLHRRDVIPVLGLGAPGLPVFHPDPTAHRTSACLHHHLPSPPYTMIFSKIRSQPIQAVSARTMATLRPHFTRPTRRVKDIVRKSPVALETVAFAMQLAGQLGSSVLFLQGVMEATAKILERIEAIKRHHKDCKELGKDAQLIIDMMWSTTETMPEEDLDDTLRLHLAELETALEGIIAAMHDLRKQSRLQRVLRKQHNDAALSENKDKLKNALRAFQYKELIATHCYQARAVRLSDDSEGKRVDSSRGRDSRNPIIVTYIVFGLQALAQPFFFSTSLVTTCKLQMSGSESAWRFMVTASVLR